MAGMTSSGLIDIIIALVAVEATAIWLWRMKTGNGPGLPSIFCNLLAGSFLLLALRNALVDASFVWIALCLLAALIAHALDVLGRWEHASQRTSTKDQQIMNATLSLRVSERDSRLARRAQTKE